MVGVSFLLPIWFDLAAVFLFALTGVWAATKRGYDVVGAFVLAFGGLLRDGIFLREIPAVAARARDPVQLEDDSVRRGLAAARRRGDGLPPLATSRLRGPRAPEPKVEC